MAEDKPTKLVEVKVTRNDGTEATFQVVQDEVAAFKDAYGNAPETKKVTTGGAADATAANKGRSPK